MWTRLALGAILVCAAVLRTRGISFGLPFVYNPDEVAIMSRALAFATGDLNPHNFLYPTLYFYVLAGAVGLYYVFGTIAGQIASLSAFQQSFFLDPTGIYLAGRTLGVLCGVASVALTWSLGARLGGPLCAAAAALFLAVAPFAVRDAHYVKHDVPATLAVLAAVLVMLPLADPASPERTVRRVGAAGVLAGLACSIHYYAVFVLVPLVLALWMGWRHEPRRRRLQVLGACGAVAAAAFLAGSPFLLVEPHLAWRDIRANRQIVVDRAVEGGEVLFASTREYAGMLGSDATGWPVVALSVAGLVLLVRNAPSRGLLLIAFPLTFLLFIANTVAATRYLNPVLPFVAVWAGVAVGSFGRRPPGRTAVAVTLIVVAALPGLLASWRTGSFFRQMDTRTLALEYMAAHVPEGASVLIQPYSVPVYQSREGLLEALRLHIGDPERASTKFRIQLALTVWPSPAYRTLYLGRGGLDLDKIYLDYADFEGDARLEALGRHDVHYVVLKRYNDEPAAIRPLVDALGREAQRLAVFSPYAGSPDTWRTSPVAPFLHNTDARLDDALERPGPVIEIWQVP